MSSSSTASRRSRRSRTSTYPRASSSDSGEYPIQDDETSTSIQSSMTNQNVSPNTEDKVHRVKIESDRTGWGRISDLLHQYDRARVDDVKEDIDSLLVFAGLFSAVITAFIIESYKTLQQQPEDTTNQILLQISAQLASLTLSGNFINSTIPSLASPPFAPARFSVLINTLWLLSLVFALITASLGILIKQWLHELMARDTQDPCQQVKIRFFREVGVQRWQIFEIAASLPLLLQLALLLFFIGLSAFLHDLNTAVTWVVTGVMILWLVFYLFTTFSPAFSSQCPYKTPMLKGFLYRLRVGNHTWLLSLARALYTHIPATWPTVRRRSRVLCASLRTWSAAWVACEETKVCESDTWDLPSLICSQEILRGEELDETITDCLRDSNLWSLFHCIELFSQGKDPVIQRVLPDVSQGLTCQTCELFLSCIGDLDISFDESLNTPTMYLRVTYASSKTYKSLRSSPILPALLPMFIRLINEDPNPAVYSILTMYSIRHNTMEHHPECFNNLFHYISDDEMQAYSIGSQFVLNLVVATRAICRYIWKQSQVDSDIDMEGIVRWIDMARSDSDPDIPIDPIALVSTFAEVLHSLVSFDVILEHRGALLKVMDELANILHDLDVSLWPSSRRKCVEGIHECFFDQGLREGRLLPELGNLIRTWKPNFNHG